MLSLVELQLLFPWCQQRMKFVMSPGCLLTCELLCTLQHHRAELLRMDLCSAPQAAVPATQTTRTIDINWHPPCSLQGEAKDLMGVGSELFPFVSRWSLQGCADTHGQCQTPELPPLVMDLLH